MEAKLFVKQEAIRFEIYKLLAECYYPPDEALSDKIKIWAKNSDRLAAKTLIGMAKKF